METSSRVAGRDALFTSSDIKRVTEDTTLRPAQNLVYVVGAAAADVTVTLPGVQEAAGREYTIVYQTLTTAGFNVVVAFPAGPSIKPANIILTQAGYWVTIKSNGFAWFVAASNFTEGLYAGVRVASATWDFAVNGGDSGAIGLGVTIPKDVVIIGGFVDVITICVSANDSGTGAIHVASGNDIVSVLAISNGSNIWDPGIQPIVPKHNTPESTGIKVSTAAEITFTIATQDFTAGKFIVYLHYVPTIPAT